MVALVIVILLVLAGIKLHSPRHLPIKTVSVDADLTHIKQQAVEQIIQRSLNGKNFFTVRLSQLQHQLQGLAWVAVATIYRQWPDTLVIRLQPQQPQAVWNQKGLVNRYGEIFYPQAIQFSQQLPEFFASDPQQAFELLSYYQQFEQVLRPLALKIAIIRLDQAGSWQIRLNNGMKLQLGQTDILTKVTHFVKVYPEVFASTKKQAKVVDLRYKNGMAVQWAN